MFDQAEKLRLLSLRQAKGEIKIPNAFSVISGKGGTGKTFFAVNAAFQLSRKGEKVLLVDFDFNFANVHLFLNAEAKFTIADYLQSKVLFEDIVLSYNENLDLIIGENGNFEVDYDARRIESLIRKIEKISERYTVVIFDNSPGISDELFLTVKSSRFSVVVINPEITSVLDSYVLLKAFRKKKISVAPLVVVNKNIDEGTGRTTFENFSKAAKKFLKIQPEFLGTIPFDENVTKSILEMKTLVEFAPKSPATNAIDLIAEKITKKNQLANIQHSSLKAI